MVKTLQKLGISDKHGKPNPSMLMACKVLKINLEDLEHKTFEDFLNKHETRALESRNPTQQVTNIHQLAKKEYNFYERRRKSKISQLEDYIKGVKRMNSEMKSKKIMSHSKNYQHISDSIFMNTPGLLRSTTVLQILPKECSYELKKVSKMNPQHIQKQSEEVMQNYFENKLHRSSSQSMNNAQTSLSLLGHDKSEVHCKVPSNIVALNTQRLHNDNYPSTLYDPRDHFNLSSNGKPTNNAQSSLIKTNRELFVFFNRQRMDHEIQNKIEQTNLRD